LSNRLTSILTAFLGVVTDEIGRDDEPFALMVEWGA